MSFDNRACCSRSVESASRSAACCRSSGGISSDAGTSAGSISRSGRISTAPAAPDISSSTLRAQATSSAVGANALWIGSSWAGWMASLPTKPSRRAAQRLGFSYEGTFRQATVVKGRNRDTAWFSITDNEWPKLKSAFEKWLAPENFSASGEQKQNLAALIAAARSRSPTAVARRRSLREAVLTICPTSYFEASARRSVAGAGKLGIWPL